MYRKIVQENTPTYLKEHLPPLVSSTNPYHRRRPLQRQVPKHKTETYRQSLSPSKTTLWNDLPENIQRQNQLVKLNSFSPEMTNPPPFFYNGSRKTQITHCKLRLGISDLNYHLLNRHKNQIALVIVEKETKHLNTTFYTAHVLYTYGKIPYSNSLQIC